jgi:hypothetical protein
LRTAIRGFFADAGITVEAVPGGVRVEGREVIFNETDLRIGQGEPLIDHLVATSPLLRRLLSNAERELCSDLPVRASAADGLVHICHGDQVIALVRGTEADVRDPRPPIRGNFLAADKPWHALRRRLTAQLRQIVEPTADVRQRAIEPDEASPESSTHPVGRPAGRTLRTRFPDSMPTDLVDLATAASRELRYGRTVEYGRPLVLRLQDGHLRFGQIAYDRPVQVPLDLFMKEHRLVGALQLTSPTDPLALYVDEASSFSSMGIAWAIALVAYRDLTCLAQRSPEETVMPDNLSPTTHTRLLLASYVVGHRRHLPSGWSASEAAKSHARRIGIDLSPGNTWVRPHARGKPADEPLVFYWTPNVAVASVIG